MLLQQLLNLGLRHPTTCAWANLDFPDYQVYYLVWVLWYLTKYLPINIEDVAGIIIVIDIHTTYYLYQSLQLIFLVKRDVLNTNYLK